MLVDNNTMAQALRLLAEQLESGKAELVGEVELSCFRPVFPKPSNGPFIEFEAGQAETRLSFSVRHLPSGSE